MGNVIEEKSFSYAVRIVKLYEFLTKEKREFVLSKQLLRSGTSIGANVSEAEQGQSTNDFLSKMNIALKEAAETEYWLRLLKHTDYLDEKQYESIYSDCEELKKILHSIVKTTKERRQP
jgi:four helix bundle protein